jgi:hypothetical protein
MTMTTSDHRIADTHRRIRNILDRCPASAWTLEESQAVPSVLAGIVRGTSDGGVNDDHNPYSSRNISA